MGFVLGRKISFALFPQLVQTKYYGLLKKVRKITLLVKPNSRIEKIERDSQGVLHIWVNAPTREGKANTRLIELLAEHFKVPKSAVHIHSGTRVRRKIVEIV